MASASSDWPLPSTPATPRISPPRTDRLTSSSARVPSSRATRQRLDRAAARARRRRTAAARGGAAQLAPDHGARQLGGARRRADRAQATTSPRRMTVTRVGERQHLVELVGDEHDRLAVVDAAPRKHAEQLADLERRQHRRRLVEDEHVGAALQHLEDLHALRLADGQRRHQAPRLDAEPVALPTARRSRARRARGRANGPRHGSRPSTTFSAAVSVGTSMKCWCTMPTPARDRRRHRRARDDLAADAHLARVGRHAGRRARACSVDLPAPFSPMTACTSPRITDSDTSRLATHVAEARPPRASSRWPRPAAPPSLPRRRRSSSGTAIVAGDDRLRAAPRRARAPPRRMSARLCSSYT